LSFNRGRWAECGE